MVTPGKSNGIQALIAVLIIAGRILLVISFFYLATSFSFGWPAARWRAFAGTGLGLVAALSGAMLAERAWSPSITQIPHQSAAMAGVLFLATTVRRFSVSGFITTLPLEFCFVLSVTAVLSWWLRAGRHSLRCNRGT